MITSVHLRNFKGHVDTTIPLGRFTVFVGPNGAGKTSVLQALVSLATSALRPPLDAFANELSPSELVHRASPMGPIMVAAEGRLQEVRWKASVEFVWQEPKGAPAPNQQPWQPTVAWSYGEASDRKESSNVPFQEFAPRELSSAFLALLYRFDAWKIAIPSFIVEPLPLVNYDGEHTATVLAALKLEREEDFARIEEELRRIVPNVERIRVRRVIRTDSQPPQGGHRIHIDFRGAPNVPAHAASEGTLIALALLTAICWPPHPKLVLLDDIDHGLHPGAQIEQVRVLRRLLEQRPDLQIIATTHSPYIIDEFEPEDVVVFALRADGTVTSKRLAEHPQAAKMKSMLSAGQLWSLDPEKDWVVEEKAP